MLQIISTDGRITKKPAEDIPPEKMIQMYKDMVMTRILDNWLLRLQRTGRVAAHAPSEGQEAAIIGSAHALGPKDWIFPSYREIGAYIVIGVPLSTILHRVFVTHEDVMKGHEVVLFGDRRHRVVVGPGPVATQLPVMVGFAMAAKQRGDDTVALAYIGDGGTSKGDFHESMNFAAVFKAPAVFFCQNNQYAISIPVHRQTASATIADKAIAYGMEGVRVDGNDILACYLVTKYAVEKAREGKGPTLIEAVTYRLGPHTTADDPKTYRSEEEVMEWRKKDPIQRFKQYLINSELWSEEEDQKLRETLEKTLLKEIERIEKMPKPDPRVILEDVYALSPWHLLEEMTELEEELKNSSEYV